METCVFTIFIILLMLLAVALTGMFIVAMVSGIINFIGDMIEPLEKIQEWLDERKKK